MPGRRVPLHAEGRACGRRRWSWCGHPFDRRLPARDDRTPGVAARPGRRGRGPPAARRHEVPLCTAPGWTSARLGARGADELYAALRRRRAVARRAPPDVRLHVDVPRLLQFYGEDEPLPHPALGAGRDALSAHYARRARRAVPHGRPVPLPRRPRLGGMARRPHRPRPGPTRWSAILSVGAPRDLMLRPRGGGDVDRVPAGPRRPRRHGRLVPAHLGPLRPQDAPSPSARGSRSSSATARRARDRAPESRAPGAATDIVAHRDRASEGRRVGRAFRAGDVGRQGPVEDVARTRACRRRRPRDGTEPDDPSAASQRTGSPPALRATHVGPSAEQVARARRRRAPCLARKSPERRARRRAPAASRAPGFHEPASATTGMPRSRAAAGDRHRDGEVVAVDEHRA